MALESLSEWEEYLRPQVKQVDLSDALPIDRPLYLH